jgi:hypothetical protein
MSSLEQSGAKRIEELYCLLGSRPEVRQAQFSDLCSPVTTFFNLQIVRDLCREIKLHPEWSEHHVESLIRLLKHGDHRVRNAIYEQLLPSITRGGLRHWFLEKFPSFMGEWFLLLLKVESTQFCHPLGFRCSVRCKLDEFA